jgi:hypothetical protein
MVKEMISQLLERLPEKTRYHQATVRIAFTVGLLRGFHLSPETTITTELRRRQPPHLENRPPGRGAPPGSCDDESEPKKQEMITN